VFSKAESSPVWVETEDDYYLVKSVTEEDDSKRE
jgi:hypothetical protein